MTRYRKYLSWAMGLDGGAGHQTIVILLTALLGGLGMVGWVAFLLGQIPLWHVVAVPISVAAPLIALHAVLFACWVPRE